MDKIRDCVECYTDIKLVKKIAGQLENSTSIFHYKYLINETKRYEKQAVNYLSTNTNIAALLIALVY